MTKNNTLRPLVLAIASTLALAACGGGGGNVRSDPPPTNPPQPTPPTPPTPPPQTCQDQNAVNYGGPLPCIPRYSGIKDNLLVATSADHAHAAGVYGEGVKVGVLDGSLLPGYAALDGRITYSQDFTGRATPETSKADHATIAAALIGGKPVAASWPGDFKGGVSPKASLYHAKVCHDGLCYTDAAARAIATLGGMEVRVFNASWGGHGSAAEIERNARHMGGLIGPEVLRYDALLVTGTGNDGSTLAGDTASIPYYLPQYAGNWLVATAVEINPQGQPEGLATGRYGRNDPNLTTPFANQCGVAAQWCVALPGTYMVPDHNGQGMAYTDGTSWAAASLSGVAALVWSAHPWMSARNVQQSILTTATDLGAPGVDNVYGWGLVNAGRAVQGPGLLVDTFDANVTGTYASTFSNNIGGDGSLIKRGSGSLTLTGQNTYAGGTRVEAGTLTLSGSLGSSVNVTGGTFVSQGGRINGDYTAGEGANTAIQFGTGLTVSGNANLAGSLTLLPEPQGYSVKPTETLLTAGQVNGTFADVRYGSGFFYTASLSYTSTSVDASMVRVSSAGQATAAGSSAAVVDGARQFDVLRDHLDARVERGDTAGRGRLPGAAARLMAAPTQDAAEASLASLTGAAHGVARSLGVQQALDAAALMGERADLASRTGSSGAWAEAIGLDGTLRRAGYGKADYQQQGAAIGADIALGDDWLVGGSLGAGRHDARLGGADGALDGDWQRVGLHARLDGKRGWLTVSAGVERREQEIRRAVILGTEAAPVEGERTDRVLSLRVESGITTASGLAPFAAAGVLKHTQGAFAERGGDGLALTAGEDSASAAWAEVGVRYQRQIGALNVAGVLTATHLLDRPDTGFSAAFTDAPDATFRVAGASLPGSTLRGGLSLTWQAGQAAWLYLALGGQRGEDDQRTAWGFAGVKIGF